MQIDVAACVDDELLRAMARLIPQLTRNAPPPLRGELSALLEDSASSLLLARREGGEIIALLTLAVYRVPTGIRAVIEDVVVDEAARGQGVGAALMRRAIEIAKEKGAGNVSLTSNPMRAAANRLYVRLGFQKRETNLYQMKL